MPDLPTRVELLNVGADEVRNRTIGQPANNRISYSEVFRPGSDLNLLFAGVSAMADEVQFQAAARLQALLLDGAEGEDLDRLVADRWSPTLFRKQATPALAVLTFTRVTGPLLGLALPFGTQIRTPSGIVFALTSAVAIPPGSTGPITGYAQATTSGQATNVVIGTITEFVDQPSDPALQVTNLEPATGGDETETDASLRARARAFYDAVRRGTKAAIVFGALTVAGVRGATVVEQVDGFGDPTGIVDLYVADVQGNANAALTAAVILALVEYRAAGVQVNVIGASPVYQPIVLRLRYEAGVDSTIAFDRVRLLVVSAVNALQPQTTLERSLISAQARRVPGVIVLNDAVVTPAGDIVPATGQVIRTTTDLVVAAP